MKVLLFSAVRVLDALDSAASSATPAVGWSIIHRRRLAWVSPSACVLAACLSYEEWQRRCELC